MNIKFVLFVMVASTLLCDSLSAQLHYNYRRLAPGGAFRVPTFWTPFDPVAQPPIFGPGGSNDRAIFDLGFTLFETYTINDVNGVNERLIVEDDSVRLEITDYQTVSNDFGADASIAVGLSAGDVGILTLGGGSGSELRSVQTFLGVNGTGSAIVDSQELTWDNSADIFIGTGGNGNLRVQAGSVSCRSCAVGSGIGSQSTARVTGADSAWNIEDQLFVGLSGDGSLSIADGGIVAASDVTVGTFSSSNSELFVDGSGSCLLVSNLEFSTMLTIGSSGAGQLEIKNGGSIILDSDSFVTVCLGHQDNSLGKVIVDGRNSSLTGQSNIAVHRLFVGDEGEGELEILNGGRVEQFNTYIGVESTGCGLLSVMGAGSTLNVVTLKIGFDGDGELRVVDGTVIQTFFGNNTSIASNLGSSGVLSVQGDEAFLNLKQVCVGGSCFFEPVAGGTGLLSISSGTVVIREGLFIFDSGTVQMDGIGGLLSTPSIVFPEAGGEFDFFRGRLEVETFDGDLTNRRGVLAPGRPDLQNGNQEIGSMIITGDYRHDESNAVLEIQIGGTATGEEFDFVNVVGNVFLNGQLRLELLNGFVPSPSDELTILNSGAGALFGFFDNVGDSGRLETVDGLGSFLVKYGPASETPNQIILSDFQPGFILGDVNSDGVVDLLDVAPFVESVSFGPYIPAADINMDGEVNLLDVAPFVALLAG